MNEAGITIRTTVPLSQYTLAGIVPGKQARHFPSGPVSTQCPAVLRHCSLSIALVRSDQFNFSGSKSLRERITIAGMIPNTSFGSSHGDNLIEGSVGKGGFTWARKRRVRP